jgi:F0F1-type ATP synthase beta subunit
MAIMFALLILQATSELEYSLGLYPSHIDDVDFRDTISSDLAFLQDRSTVGENGGSVISVFFVDSPPAYRISFDVTLSFHPEV